MTDKTNRIITFAISMMNIEIEIGAMRVQAANLMANGIRLAKLRQQLCEKAPKCPRCDDVQVQIMDVNGQSWKCRSCHFSFSTAIPI